LNLIESGLKADILFNDKLIEHVSGTPQGGILSPLLSNIYLNELDKFMKTLEKKYLGLKKRPRSNPEYEKIMKKTSKYRNPKLARKLKINRTDPFDSSYQHIRYVRYADDFLVGVTGSHKLTVEIRNEIREFLLSKLGLTLNLEKTKITNISKKIPFLGYLIGRRTFLGMQHYGKEKK
jgi:retron-type reverse transcriptase